MDLEEDELLGRRLLAELQEAVTARDLNAVLRVFDTDLFVFGTAAANVDSERSVAYLTQVVSQPGTIRWEWTDVRSVARDNNLFCFVAVGTVGFDGGADGEREPFRLTCVAVNDGPRWRLRHFHGSVPQT